MSIQQNQQGIPFQLPTDKNDQAAEKQNIIASLLARYNPGQAVVELNLLQSELVAQKPVNQPIESSNTKPRWTKGSNDQPFLQNQGRSRRQKKQPTTIVIDDQPQSIIDEEPICLNSNTKSDQKMLYAIDAEIKQKLQERDVMGKVLEEPQHEPLKIAQNCGIDQAKDFEQDKIFSNLRSQRFQHQKPIYWLAESLEQSQHQKIIQQVQPNALHTDKLTTKPNETPDVRPDERSLQEGGENQPDQTKNSTLSLMSRILDPQEAEKMTDEELKQYISSLLSPNEDDLKGLTREDLIEVLRQVLKERKEQVERQKEVKDTQKRPYIQLTEEQKTLIYQILIMNERYERSLQKMSKEDIEDVLQAYAQEHPQVLNQKQEIYMQIQQEDQRHSAKPCYSQAESIPQVISQLPHLVDQTKNSCFKTSQEELNFILQKISQNQPELLHDIKGFTQSQILQVIDELKSQMHSQRISKGNHERLEAQQHRLIAANNKLQNSRISHNPQPVDNFTQHYLQRDGRESTNFNRFSVDKSANKKNYLKSKKLQGLFGKDKTKSINPNQINESKTNIQKKDTFLLQRNQVSRQPYEKILSQNQAEGSQCEQHLEENTQQRYMQHLQRRQNDQRQEARENFNTKDFSQKVLEKQTDREKKYYSSTPIEKQSFNSSKLLQNSELSKIIQQIGILPNQNKSYETVQKDEEGNLMSKTVIVVHTKYFKRQHQKVYGQDQKPVKHIKTNNADGTDQPHLQIIQQLFGNSRQPQTQQVQNSAIQIKQSQAHSLTEQEAQLKQKIRGIMIRDTMENSQNGATSDKSLQKILKSILKQFQ